MDQVKLVRRGQQVEGTLHLTPHHLIFSHSPPLEEHALSNGDAAPPKPRELWITYPIIQTCTIRLAPQPSHHLSSIRLRCRDFTFVCFCFDDDKNARDAYDSIRAWTCKIGRVEKLYAFTYQPQRPEKDVDGWSIYDPRAEWRRQGISEKGVDKGWRLSNINKDFGVGRIPGYLVSDVANTFGVVLTNLSLPSCGPLNDLRQYSELRKQVSFATPLAGLDLPTPG